MDSRCVWVCNSNGRFSLGFSTQRIAGLPAEVIVTPSFHAAVEAAAGTANLGSVFVIGGAKVYEAALESGLVETIYLTRVLNGGAIQCDTFLPAFSQDTFRPVEDPKEVQVHDEDGFRFQFLTFRNALLL